MADVKTWPVRDHEWVARHQRSTTGRHVPPTALEAHERELLDAVREAGLPAAELFGDAAVLATEDVAELSTLDEAVRTSEGGGLRSALQEVGGTLMGIGAVSVFYMLIRTGWSVDVDVAPALVLARELADADRSAREQGWWVAHRRRHRYAARDGRRGPHAGELGSPGHPADGPPPAQRRSHAGHRLGQAAVGRGTMSVAAWQRASLPMLVLEVLAIAPRHGYGISQALVPAGLQPTKGAQLYPALARLEDDGAIAAQWEQSESGPARKVYELTATGRAQRAELRAQWRAFVGATETLGRAEAGHPSS